MSEITLTRCNEQGQETGHVKFNADNIVAVEPFDVPGVTLISTVDGHRHWVKESVLSIKLD